MDGRITSGKVIGSRLDKFNKISKYTVMSGLATRHNGAADCQLKEKTRISMRRSLWATNKQQINRQI
ncbi:hypothetical protein X777_01864 [Ooceraea biroi]|uniref:Uncharacterized protein n=1 Tax=Ooceraea biroi TaxID=2015173 RepID=A0A026WR64_OOCBI|nr:hypothetical protein X777_01864 [Ooceraea biroi]